MKAMVLDKTITLEDYATEVRITGDAISVVVFSEDVFQLTLNHNDAVRLLNALNQAVEISKTLSCTV